MSFLPDKLVMVDAEMTGVDETKYELLQAAFVKLELGEDCQYHEVGEPLVLFFKSDATPSNNFHKKYLTHIFDACNKSDMDFEKGKELLEEWLGDWKGVVTPTGDCVHTDLAFLKQNGVVTRNDIIDDEPVPGTFHYEAFDLNPLKAFARHKKGEKYSVSGIDEENVHDALVDCRNQTKELNSYLQVLLPEHTLSTAGAFKELAIEEEDRRLAEEKEITSAVNIPWQEVFKEYDRIERLGSYRQGPGSWPDEVSGEGRAHPPADFENLEWETDDVEIKFLKWKNLNFFEPIWTEGYKKPSIPFSEEMYATIMDKWAKKEKLTDEEHTFADKWGDEFQARKYAKLETEPPPIFVVWDAGYYQIWNGRHRVRAAILNGKNKIRAFIGCDPEFIESNEAKIKAIGAVKEPPVYQFGKELHTNFQSVYKGSDPDMKSFGKHRTGHAYGNLSMRMDLYLKNFGEPNFFHVIGHDGVISAVYAETDKDMIRLWSYVNIKQEERWHEFEYQAHRAGFNIQSFYQGEVKDAKGYWLKSAYSEGMETKLKTMRRIKASEQIDPMTLPEAVQPAVADDGSLPADKRSVVDSYLTKALRADSFQDFQELLNKVMLDAQLIEDFRPSVAGILNEHRITQGYVAL